MSSSGLKTINFKIMKTQEEMQKYWIKNLTEKQVIHAPTEEIAKKLCNKLHELGLKLKSGHPYSENELEPFKEKTCYNPNRGTYDSTDYYMMEEYQILTIDQLMDFQEYPKVMEVSNANRDWRKRVVFMEKNGKFLAWVDAESIEEAERENNVCAWKFAREIQAVPTLELTIDEIANKFNVSPEQIKIKK